MFFSDKLVKILEEQDKIGFDLVEKYEKALFLNL